MRSDLAAKASPGRPSPGTNVSSPDTLSIYGELSTTVILYSARWKTITVAIVDYLFSATIGPAYALGTILIVLVLAAITLANRILGRRMSQMFKMV